MWKPCLQIGCAEFSVNFNGSFTRYCYQFAYNVSIRFLLGFLTVNYIMMFKHLKITIRVKEVKQFSKLLYQNI
jgi:hypothetical protein